MAMDKTNLINLISLTFRDKEAITEGDMKGLFKCYADHYYKDPGRPLAPWELTLRNTKAAYDLGFRYVQPALRFGGKQE